MAYLWDRCLCQMGLKVTGGLKKFLVRPLRQGGSIGLVPFAHYSYKQLIEITFIVYFFFSGDRNGDCHIAEDLGKRGRGQEQETQDYWLHLSSCYSV